MIDTVPDILARIVAKKREELARAPAPVAEWERRAELCLAGRRDFCAALCARAPAIIAEIKKASPSRGVLAAGFDPVAFQNVSASAGEGFLKPAAHRGLAVGDLDNDGRMNAVMSVLNGQAQVFHNTTRNANHWILLKLTGTKSNRMGIGARIRLTTPDGLVQYNHVTTSTGYASSSDSRVHFGLAGSAAAREIEITWPSGIRQVLRDVAADRVVPLTEPAK